MKLTALLAFPKQRFGFQHAATKIRTLVTPRLAKKSLQYPPEVSFKVLYIY